jgi:tetratricopeptide (TPR) repeat protein
LLQPLLDKLLADEGYARWPGLWRLAATLAERRGQAARSLQCTERAMDLEYQSLGEQVNVQTIRTQYGQLLGRYQQVAAALATVGSQPPADFLDRVIRAADRWRAIDTDPTAACQAAARIFADLGAADLAWAYLTTPLAARPNEAAPWVSLAETLRQQGQFELADRAYASAFEAEPTNARILWDRAQVLQQTGRAAEAKKLLRQISESEWQPAFSGLKSQAKEAVGF